MDALTETISKLSHLDRERFEKIKSLSLKYPDLFKNIKPTLTKLESYEDTVSEVFRLAYQYPEDLEEYKDKSIFELYNYARLLPYCADPIGLETVSRFKYTKEPKFPIRDCDDKTVPILAKAIIDKIPCRAIVCGKGDRPHHIYPELQLNGFWIPADATYPLRSIFGQKLYGEKFRREFYLTDFQKKF
ncbi:hypothetical protein [Leptospira interrogans]|uniref:hypothetical protein n=1 Tax=Leptospira interrogans TaxID=173 RepID=UPI000297EDA7|nr:hypothetical protein [Leptospira interrogans]KAA1293778.1 hypothetical protein C4X99_01475 [Leptospira interrogans serovar Geyaweera]EKR25605.1 hypothetical protein LEP1GSC087_2972 [Leptospira interrogans serovar Bataviae str. L1111]EMJ45747.1 hypothetical protein LEP1GSC111_2099 [Leptospira interrogans str. UT126]QCO33069.1 hypothetical protein E4414_08280 [Leptospira interrogans]UML86435.1 hypothetical protein FH587_13605 [Leptospira interrogans]